MSYKKLMVKNITRKDKDKFELVDKYKKELIGVKLSDKKVAEINKFYSWLFNSVGIEFEEVDMDITYEILEDKIKTLVTNWFKDAGISFGGYSYDPVLNELRVGIHKSNINRLMAYMSRFGASFSEELGIEAPNISVAKYQQIIFIK